MPARQIREARLDEAAALSEAERAIVRHQDGLFVSEPDELNEAVYRQRIAAQQRGTTKVLVAEVDGRIVGHAALVPMSLRKIAHVLRLDLCVHLGHWRRGHGEALLRALIDWAVAQPGAHKIELLVRAENAPAIALYEKLGFIIEGRLRHRLRLRDGRYIDDIAIAMLLDERRVAAPGA